MEFDIELHKIFGMKKHSFGDIQFLLVIKFFVQWQFIQTDQNTGLAILSYSISFISMRCLFSTISQHMSHGKVISYSQEEFGSLTQICIELNKLESMVNFPWVYAISIGY